MVKEYNRIFHDLFGGRGPVYRKIVEHLADGPKSYSSLAENAEYVSGGPFSDYLNELVSSGFISRDYAWNFKNGKDTDASKFRLKDNYLRFYLKCIAPHLSRINKELYLETALTNIPGLYSIMGLQFENLVLQNRRMFWEILGINEAEIVNENPFYQHTTKHQQGCQIDYLIQTKFNVLYVSEIKLTQNTLGTSVINEVKEKISRLKKPRGFSCKPILIHAGEVSEALVGADYFAATINVSDILLD